MKIAIMQPYFLPYIGYWQLINAVDKFVIYDNIQFVKRGWFHRNYILYNEKKMIFTLPIKHDDFKLNVNQRYLADNSKKELRKIFFKIYNAYKNSPYFTKNIKIFEKIFYHNEKNLFHFIMNSIYIIIDLLDLDRNKIIITSSIPINHELKAEKKIFEICHYFKADTYINPIGGLKLYNKEEFKREGINLYFLKTLKNKIRYKQFSESFVEDLSIIDVLMFNSKQTIKKMLDEFELI